MHNSFPYKKAPPWRCLFIAGCRWQSDHVLDVGVVEALELFDFVVHLDLQAGCRCVIAIVEGVDEEREEGLLIDAVLGEVAADAVDLVPVVGIEVGDEVRLGFLGCADDVAVLRDDAGDELGLPARQSTSAEGFDDLVTQCAASRDDGELCRVVLEVLHVLPDRSWRSTEEARALFFRVVFEDIVFTAVCAVFLEVEALFTGILGDLGEAFCRRMRSAGLDTVEASRVDGCEDEVRIRVRVAGTQLKARCIRVAEIADQASEDRAVTRRDLRRMAEGRDDADRSLEARFEAVEGIVRSGDERVDDLVVLEQAHEGAVTDGAHEVFLLVISREEVVELAVFRDGSHADVRVLAVASQADHRFCLEVDFEAHATEDLSYDRADEELIVGSLQGICKAPVDFELLADVRHAAALVNLCFETADFLMAHLDLEAVFIEDEQALLHSRADDAVRALPVLLLQNLRSRHLFDGSILKRCLDPELELRSGGELDVRHIRAVDALDAGNLRVLLEEGHQLFLDIGERVSEDSARIDALAFVDQEGRNAQRADWLARLLVVVLHVVVDEPVDGRIDRHIDFRVVQGGDARQYDGRTIRLDSRASIELIDILEEDAHRDLLIRIVAGHIDADQRYELDLGMCFERVQDFFFFGVCRNHIK